MVGARVVVRNIDDFDLVEVNGTFLSVHVGFLSVD